MANRPQQQYVTPDTALKQSEGFLAENKWQSAVQILNAALQNRRIKGNNSMLERIMVSWPASTKLTKRALSCRLI